MNIILIKYRGALIPETEQDYEKITKLKDGQSYLFKTSRVRSPERHREFFGCLNIVRQNLPENVDIRDMDEFLYYIKEMIVCSDWKRGMEESIGGRINRKGKFIPTSISWSKMNEDEFEKWRNLAYPIIAKMIGLTASELLAEYHSKEMSLKR